MSEQRPDYVTDAMEMMGIDLDAPKQIVQEISGFTPLFDCVVQQYHDETRAAVHGIMWRFCQMTDGVCKASLEKIADMIGVSSATAMRHAEALCDDGYFKDLTPDLKNKPHVYADTGKVVMKSKISATLHSETSRFTEKRHVSESQLNKVLNKDSIKQPEEEALAQISQKYESEIGLITSMIADELRDASAVFPLKWVLDAIHESAVNNKRNWKYALAILKRWKAQGHQGDNKPTNKQASKTPKGVQVAQDWLASLSDMEIVDVESN